MLWINAQSWYRRLRILTRWRCTKCGRPSVLRRKWRYKNSWRIPCRRSHLSVCWSVPSRRRDNAKRRLHRGSRRLPYSISCSKSANGFDAKNWIVMSQPSHSFLMVEIVALLLRPLTILLTVDCVTPLILHSLLMEISRSWHNSTILSLTASPSFLTVRDYRPNQNFIN